MGKKFLVLLFVFVACTAVFANGNVTGTVYLGPPPAGPAAGATVTLHRMMHPDDSLSTTTDADGHFGFTDIESGGWNAVTFLEGYLPGFGMVFVPWNGETVDVSLMLGPPLGETGSVTGVVLKADGTPAANAHVHLAQMGEWDPHHQHWFMVETITNESGEFAFDTVPAGNYHIDAGLMGEGFASATIEVFADQTTNVTLTLSGEGHHGGPGHHCDSLTVVELSGTVSLFPDSMHPEMVHYFLDVDGDGTADYRLGFGPPWYNPNCDTCGVRPNDGDQITVVGGLLTYGDPPLVVVYRINGLFWREPCHHGGHGGGHHGMGCDPDSISAIEVEGTAVVDTFHTQHGLMDRYGIDTNADGTADYALMFGPPAYDPNGPEEPNRPLNGDAISIVGGLMECENMPIGVIIVYEINGMFWREPGDTSGFSAYDIGTEEAGIPAALPVSYLTAANYPNPFNPSTSISYSLPVSGTVTLKVFDIVGREVATLVNEVQTAGAYHVTWDASNNPSGIYLYRVTAAGQSVTGRMILMK
jgi:hypothetical protein